MQNYTLRCAYRFLDGRSGLAVDCHSISEPDADSAVRTARELIADRPGLTLVSAVMTLDAHSQIIWSLKTPMAAADMACAGWEGRCRASND